MNPRANNASTLTLAGTPPGGANVTVANITTVWSGNYWYNQLTYAGNNTMHFRYRLPSSFLNR